MKVLIFGASGFIGFPAAQALVRAGHTVYGQTRSEEKSQRLEAEEIIPIVCDPESDAWHSLVPTLDVVIEALGGTAIKQVVAASVREAVASATQRFRPSHAPKLAYIYTSGCWVHGDNRSEIVTDTTPITKPVELVAWRPDQEQAVITHPALNGIVVRPVMLYGKSGSIFASVFKRAHEEGKVTWPGTPGGKLSLIHADDLADLYVRMAEGAAIAGGKIFDAGNDVLEDMDAFLKKLSQIAGLDGKYAYTKPTNIFEVALSATVLARPYLGRALLGWQPKKIGLTDGLETYYKAYLASVDESKNR
ncbi:NAD(P)-binding protein [Lentinula aff. detonsa]|uniref:NAD(P)-binding protein n=1 Tax=Lentinula aff. detonsa TaxID=2804958 RepID=A0AA38L0D5_9AGAR|nr:NAD(P)-binding protein [Lentinula aff. detonsa]